MHPNTTSIAPAQAGPQPHQTGSHPSAMQAAFLHALAERVATNPSGQVTLPTGTANAGEVAKVLRALDRARAPLEDHGPDLPDEAPAPGARTAARPHRADRRRQNFR
jgi:hypothetical protein